jgi:hypothetical protein
VLQRGNLYSSFLAVPIGAGIVLLGRDVIRLWVGVGYEASRRGIIAKSRMEADMSMSGEPPPRRSSPSTSRSISIENTRTAMYHPARPRDEQSRGRHRGIIDAHLRLAHATRTFL